MRGARRAPTRRRSERQTRDHANVLAAPRGARAALTVHFASTHRIAVTLAERDGRHGGPKETGELPFRGARLFRWLAVGRQPGLASLAPSSAASPPVDPSFASPLVPSF